MSKEERVAKAHQIIASISQNLTDLVDIFMSDKFTDELPAVEHKKKRRDPNAPKLPTSNFFLFTNSIREEVEKAHPDSTFAEKSKIYGARWQKLSDEERKPFNERAKEEREKYNKEMAIYEASLNGDHTDKKAKKESKPAASPPKAAAAVPAKSSKTKAAPVAPVAKPAKASKASSPTKTAAKSSKTAAPAAAPVKASSSKAAKAAAKKVVEESSSSDSDSEDSSSSDSDDSE
ncbi:high mobility group box domain-containing protein [Helicostylum pulchrum]|nr:high mobility group box domain-containing protein [Helicostylum pulchrum]